MVVKFIATLILVLAIFEQSSAQVITPPGGGGGGSITVNGGEISSIGATTATNPSAEASLKELTIPAGTLNSANFKITAYAGGSYTTAAGQTPTMRFRVKLCTVSGCGSGTVLTLFDGTTAATTAATTNSWEITGTIGTASTGATGTVRSKWFLKPQLGAAGVALGTAAATPAGYIDANTAPSASIDLTAQLFLLVTILNSSSNASNTVTEDVGWISFGGSSVTPTNTVTLTGKTIDAEASGNTITIPFKMWLPMAGCQNATAILLWDSPPSNPGVAACVTGTNTQKGVADFADGANSLSLQITLLLAEDWSGAIDAKFVWFSSTTAGDVVWQIATICVADGATDDPAFNTASTVTDTTKGSANQLNFATITGVTTTGCTAGSVMHVKVFRDPANAADNMAGTARLIGVQLTKRRAL